MEPTIPDGSHCLFRTDRGGTRQGKLVLVWQRGVADSALGGEFSVKKYESTKGASADGGWSHREIRLKPLNPDPSFRDLVFTPDAEGNLHVIGEFVAVDAIADNDYNLTASRYKPRVAEAVPDEDPAELIREVLAIEREIAAGLEKLLGEVE